MGTPTTRKRGTLHAFSPCYFGFAPRSEATPSWHYSKMCKRREHVCFGRPRLRIKTGNGYSRRTPISANCFVITACPVTSSSASLKVKACYLSPSACRYRLKKRRRCCPILSSAKAASTKMIAGRATCLISGGLKRRGMARRREKMTSGSGGTTLAREPAHPRLTSGGGEQPMRPAKNRSRTRLTFGLAGKNSTGLSDGRSNLVRPLSQRTGLSTGTHSCDCMMSASKTTGILTSACSPAMLVSMLMER